MAGKERVSTPPPVLLEQQERHKLPWKAKDEQGDDLEEDFGLMSLEGMTLGGRHKEDKAAGKERVSPPPPVHPLNSKRAPS